MIALTEPETIGRIKAVTKEGKWSLRVESASWRAERVGYYWGTPRLLTLSAIGPDTAVKAVRAILYCPQVKCEFRVQEELGEPRKDMERHPSGYHVFTARLAPGAIHLVAIACVEGLLTDISDAALWRELNSERYTTPLLRSWIPWLRQKLSHEELLVAADGFGCSAGLLLCTQEQLDEAVSQGVREGHLKMEE